MQLLQQPLHAFHVGRHATACAPVVRSCAVETPSAFKKKICFALLQRIYGLFGHKGSSIPYQPDEALLPYNRFVSTSLPRATSQRFATKCCFCVFSHIFWMPVDAFRCVCGHISPGYRRSFSIPGIYYHYGNKYPTANPPPSTQDNQPEGAKNTLASNLPPRIREYLLKSTNQLSVTVVLFSMVHTAAADRLVSLCSAGSFHRVALRFGIQVSCVIGVVRSMSPNGPQCSFTHKVEPVDLLAWSIHATRRAKARRGRSCETGHYFHLEAHSRTSKVNTYFVQYFSEMIHVN